MLNEPRRIATESLAPISHTPISQERQAAARYPELFLSPTFHSLPGRRRRVRAGSGLVLVVARHGLLAPREAVAIAEYRLHQYMLAGLYDPLAVERLNIAADPAMEALDADDFHFAMGDRDGRFLCYVCFQSPLPITDRGAPARAPRMGDTNRPTFPCESEYGLGIYGSHPEIARVPVSGVRELTRLVRNQAIRTPMDPWVVLEAIVGIARIICDPDHAPEAIIGCAGLEVRRLLYGLGLPVAYAPHAAIIGDNRGGGAPGGELLWSEQSHVAGRFWPLAIAASDIRALTSYFDALDAALALSAEQIGEALRAARPHGLLRPPAYAADVAQAGGVFWTGDPFYPLTELAV